MTAEAIRILKENMQLKKDKAKLLNGLGVALEALKSIQEIVPVEAPALGDIIKSTQDLKKEMME